MIKDLTIKKNFYKFCCFAMLQQNDKKETLATSKFDVFELEYIENVNKIQSLESLLNTSKVTALVEKLKRCMKNSVLRNYNKAFQSLVKIAEMKASTMKNSFLVFATLETRLKVLAYKNRSFAFSNLKSNLVNLSGKRRAIHQSHVSLKRPIVK